MSTPIMVVTAKYEYHPMYVLTDEAYQQLIDQLVNHPFNMVNKSGNNSAGQVRYLHLYLFSYSYLY